MDDRDELDLRLSEHAARWRATLPVAAEPDLRFPAERSTTRALRLPALAALATAVVFAGVWFLGGRHSETPSPATPPTANEVVPWAALPTTDPVLPTTRGGPSAQEIAAARPCAAGDLTVLRRDLEPAMGTAYLTVQLALDGPTPCRIEGYSEVFLLDPTGAVLDVEVEPDVATGPQPVLVTPTEPAAVVVTWSPSHYCGQLDNPRIRIGIPDNAGEVTVDGFGPTTCNPGEGRPAPRVLPLQPAYDQSPTSPYEHVTVTGDLDLAVGVGADIDFEVTLTSPVDLPLVPCPDYEILVGPRLDAHALNCSAVPHTDGVGRPYLPAGVPVTFAMHADGIEPAMVVTKFLWTLTAPGHPGVGGTLQVGDAAVAEARISGLVTMDGGPAPGTSVKVTEGVVHVVGADVDLTAPIEGGQFEVSVPPGTYRVWATTPQYGDGAGECPVAQDPDGNFGTGAKIVIDSGETMQVHLSCQMR